MPHIRNSPTSPAAKSSGTPRSMAKNVFIDASEPHGFGRVKGLPRRGRKWPEMGLKAAPKGSDLFE